MEEKVQSEVLETKDVVTISEKMLGELISTTINGQSAATRLDAVIRYVATEEYPKREVILSIAGINLQPNSQQQGQDGKVVEMNK